MTEEGIDPKRKKKVYDVEVEEFVKMLKRSEYSVVEQLKKAPAQISILSLLSSSEAHRNALLKVLNESHALLLFYMYLCPLLLFSCALIPTAMLGLYFPN